MVESACQNQVIKISVADIIGKDVENAVLTIENCMHEVILSAMDKLVTPRVEMAVRSVTGSSGLGPNTVVQNPLRREVTGNTENSPLISAAIRLALNFDQDRRDWTRDIESFEDGDFPALGLNFERRTQTHRMVTGLNAP